MMIRKAVRNPEIQNEGGEKGESGIMKHVASFIVDKRMLFFLLYILAIIFSLFSRSWVSVENDLSEYLPATTETRQGIELMKDQFITYGSAKIMVDNITYDEAASLAERLRKEDGVSQVSFADQNGDEGDYSDSYRDGSALFNITFRYDENDEKSVEALDRVESELKGYDTYVSTELGDREAATIEAEIRKIMVLVAFVVAAVLLFTSESFGEIPVLVMTFLSAMILNMGTNFLFGKISFVSNSVSSILQLALSVDYAIIYCNRYKEERMRHDVHDAAVVALAKSIPEILSSSLTTISGLFALVFMQYKIGADMGIILIKAILLSLLSVFTLMPGLLVVFSGIMEKTKHKSFVPKISGVGSFAYATRKVVPVIFLAVVVVAGILSNKCPYVYGYTNLTPPVENSTQKAERLIDQTFGTDNVVALIVPGHDYQAESRLINALEQREEVDHCTGLANTEAMGGYMLTDKLTPRQFSELVGIEYEMSAALYTSYAADQSEYGRIVGGISSYKVPLLDMLLFVHRMADEGYVSLGADLTEKLDSAYTQISDGKAQLMGDEYDRILVYLNLPEESTRTFRFLDEIHSISGKYYSSDEADKILVAGNSTSERDLKASFARDNMVVTVVSILFVLIILLFTFKSAGMPVLLIAVIEGAIFINFAVPTLMKSPIFFMSYLIVSSIQMGANIDYAIVISSRFQELRHKGVKRKQAITEALNFSFPTIITSGSMMILSGLFIGQMTSNPCISGIGQCLARGTVISVILVLFVLPQILVVGDKIIAKTEFEMERSVKSRSESGLVYVNGTIRGQVNGTVIGSMNAVVRGDVSAVVVSGTMEPVPEEESTFDEDDTTKTQSDGKSDARTMTDQQEDTAESPDIYEEFQETDESAERSDVHEEEKEAEGHE